MTTGIPGSTARRNQTQQVGYLRFSINFNDTGISSGVNKQWLPAGAIITDTSVYVGAAFNAGTTNVITIGLGASANTIVASGQVSPGAVGLTNAIVPTGNALGPLASDLQVNVTYTQTGAAATAGSAVVMIKYIPNNDL
jgi:hypothetical protein